MSAEEIIKLASVVGLVRVGERWTEPLRWGVQEIERFAALVAAAEREACALICDDIETDRWALFKGREPYVGKESGRSSYYVQGESDGAGKCADAIRARSTQ